MEAVCKHCKKTFVKPHFNSLYCSIRCKRKLYTRKDSDRMRKYNKIYYSNNKELYKKLWQDYYKANKDRLNSKSIERYYRLKKESPELIKKWNTNGSYRYRQTEKGKLSRRVCSHNRRLKTIGRIDKNQWLEKLKSFGGKCAYCGSLENIQIDHIIPISLDGDNHIDNLQPLCSHCNASKGNKIKDEEKVRHSK